MESNIKGKIAFISGASSGIGKATAEKLAEMGANLIICARRENILNELKEKLEKQYGIKVKTLVFDVRSYSDVLKNINSLRSEIGSTQNAVFKGMNALAARSVANANSVENLDSSDIAKSLEENLQANLKLHAASLAKAHDTTSLAAKLDKLLGE